MDTETSTGKNVNEITNTEKKTFFEKYSKLIIFILLMTLPVMGIGVSWSLQNMRNNMKEWLPGGTVEAERHRWFQKNFPMEQFILLSWEDCTLDDPRLDVIKHRLTPRREKVMDEKTGIETETEKVVDNDFNLRFYEKIQTGNDLMREMRENYPSMTYEEALGRLAGSIIGMDKEHTSVLILLKAGSEEENMKAPVGEIYRWSRQKFFLDKRDLTPRQLAAAERILEKTKNLPEEPANFLEKQVSKPLDDAKIAEEKIGKKDGVPIPEEYLLALPGLQPSQVHMGGPPTDNIAIDVEGTRTLLRLAWLSGVVGLTIAIVFLHSVRLVYIVFTTAFFSTGFALASVSFSGVATDAIMLSMPPLVYVLTMSGSIHIINYYHDAVAELGTVRGAPELALKHAIFPAFVCAFTTALGLLSLLTSSLGPIYKFGLYSAWGVMLALVMYFLYLPAMLQLFPSYDYLKKVQGHKHFEERSDIIERFWQFFGKLIVAHPYIVLTICFGLMAWGALGLRKLEPSVKLMKFFVEDTTIVKDYKWLEETLGPLVPMEVVVRFDNEKNKESMLERLRLVKRVAKTSRSHKEVGGILSAVTMTPSLDRESIVRDLTLDRRLSANYGKLREFVTYDLPAAEKKYKQRTKQSPSLAELGKEIVSPDIRNSSTELTDVRHRYDALTATLKQHGVETLDDLREKREKLLTTNILSTDDDILLQNIVYLWQAANCDELWRVTSRVGALTDLDYGDFVSVLREVIDPVVEYHIKSRELRNLANELKAENKISEDDYKQLDELIQDCDLDYRLTRGFQSIWERCDELRGKSRLSAEDVKPVETILDYFSAEQRYDLTFPDFFISIGKKFLDEKKLTDEEFRQWKQTLENAVTAPKKALWWEFWSWNQTEDKILAEKEARLAEAFQSFRNQIAELRDKSELPDEDINLVENMLEHFCAERRQVLMVPEFFTSLGKKFRDEEKLTAEEFGQWKQAMDDTRLADGYSLERAKLFCVGDLPSLTDKSPREALTMIVDKNVSGDDVRWSQEVEAIYTGAVPLVYKTQHALMESLYESVLLAFVTIGLVMMLVLRSPIGGFLAMIPNIFPIIVVFGFMGHFGILLDLGAMMTASVALGIVTDDTIHYLTWYRRGLDEGFDNRGAILLAYRRCGTAMTETTFICGLGLAVFMFSTFTPTLTFGLMMLTLLFTATFGDLFFTPAILTGIGGKYFAAGSKAFQKKKEEKTELTEEPSPVTEHGTLAKAES